jgi:hypothetical protein
MAASGMKHAEVIKWLVKAGADVHSKLHIEGVERMLRLYTFPKLWRLRRADCVPGGQDALLESKLQRRRAP